MIHERRRAHLVEDQLVRRGIRDPRVLEAMREVPRHAFLPPAVAHLAYRDEPVEIGEEQTISQPYVVALCCERARVRPGDRVLDAGTGSGYQAAVLAAMGADVVSIEIRPGLAARARQVLEATGYPVEVHVADAWDGWPDRAPYQAILVAAASARVPPALLDQLAEGGHLIAPVGDDTHQELIDVQRTPTGFERRRVAAVRFVSLTGRARVG